MKQKFERELQEQMIDSLPTQLKTSHFKIIIYKIEYEKNVTLEISQNK